MCLPNLGDSQNQFGGQPSNKDITKIRLYEACALSVLYGAKIWPAHRPLESRIADFHTRYLRLIISVQWIETMTNADIFNLTRSDPPSSRLKCMDFDFAGLHDVLKVSLFILISLLKVGIQSVACRRLRLIDVLERNLKDLPSLHYYRWTAQSKERGVCTSTGRASLFAGKRTDNCEYRKLKTFYDLVDWPLFHCQSRPTLA